MNMNTQQLRHLLAGLLGSLLIATLFAGCKDGDAVFADINDPEYDFKVAGEMVRVDLSMNISSSRSSNTSSRLSNNVTQTSTGTSRIVSDIYLIPFAKKGVIEATDRPLVDVAGGLSYVGSTSYHYYGQPYNVPRNTASFLCYGRAVPEPGGDEVNGAILCPDLSKRHQTEDIYFAPKPIVNSTAVQTDAALLANYLTTIANAGSWASNVTSESMPTGWKLLFEMFVNDGQPMPGSSANVTKYVAQLRTDVELQADGALKTAVLAAIDATAGLPANYPGSIGLPDGAAVVKWNAGTKTFVAQPLASTVVSTVSQNRYVYPAELYFYANSRIDSSNNEVERDSYVGKTWEQVLDNYYPFKNSTVSTNTKAVAIVNPLRYGVGCLQGTIQAEYSELIDADGKVITIGAETFPLTGILVSGQYKQQFNFAPKADELQEYVIYDRSIRNDIYLSHSAASVDFSTLTFQSKEPGATTDGTIWLALEFVNNSGKIFRGANNGWVYPGTKFYLVGSLTPGNTPVEDYEKRVFTQSWITMATMKVASLDKAYNVVPDLLSGRLEVGVQLVSDWIEATTTDVILR